MHVHKQTIADVCKSLQIHCNVTLLRKKSIKHQARWISSSWSGVFSEALAM